MTAKHTPGPWQSKSDFSLDDQLTIIGNVDGEIIDGIHHPSYDVIARCLDEFEESLPNAAANARLIAAAPDLLAAVTALMNCKTENPIRMNPGERKALWAAHDQARAAIFKATGDA